MYLHILFVQQLRKLNQTVIIGTSEWAATEKMIELGGRAVEGVIVSQFFDRYSAEQRYIRFKNAYKKRFGEDPGFPSVVSYDAANVIMDALAQQEQYKDLKQTILAAKTFDGLQGKITFNKFGDSDRKTYLSIIRNGRFVALGKDKTPVVN